MKTLIVVFSLVLVALVGVIVSLLPSPLRAGPPVVRREPAPDLPLGGAPRLPAAVPAAALAVDARPQIRHVIEVKRTELQTPDDVARYLDDLKAQARRNRRVTALEVEPGIAALRAHYEPEQATRRIGEFAIEMAQLSAQLEGRDHQPPAPDLDVLARSLEGASGDARQSLIRDYLGGVRGLPPEERTQRLAWLDQNAARR